MKIAICDDSRECIDRITELLQPYIQQEGLEIDSYISGESFLEASKDYDIIFLDIEMEQVSGLDVAQKLYNQKSNSIIFFVTNHVSYVSDTFRLRAFQFLIKPIKEKDFQYDFERAIETYRRRHEKYEIKGRNTRCILEYGNIFYIEAYNRHLYVYTETDKYECVGKIKKELIKLEPYDFIQCHQGFIVNMNKIIIINMESILLKNGIEIPMSRNFRPKVIEAFNVYLADRNI